MRSIVLVGVLAGLAAGCSSHAGQEAASAAANSKRAPTLARMQVAPLPRAQSTIANLADRGELIAYSDRAPRREGATTWREIQLSEAHAIQAIKDGGMVVQAPDGRPIRLDYARHVDHGDGNWTWVGRPAGAKPGTEAMLTFGPKAVFGSIPNGTDELEIATARGHTYMVQTDSARYAAEQALKPQAFAPDSISAPVSNATRAGDLRTAASSLTSSAMTSKSSALTSSALTASAAPLSGSGSTSAFGGNTVDLAIGYSPAFATRLGGASQALTRLNSIVDIANQALLNSRVSGQFRLVRTVQVDVLDNTQNRATLMQLSGMNCTNTAAAGQRYLPDSGVNCTAATIPAGLQPLLQARDTSGADLAVLVRNLTQPEQQSCGVAWLIGGAQTGVGAAAPPLGLSVISDSSGSMFPSNGSVCRNETLAHELGHNLGLAHDRVTAADADDSNTDGNNLDPEEFGRYPYAFGYKTDATGGNFYDVMAVPTLGQTSFRIYSNPRLTFCGGARCGIAGQADAALALGQTLPVVAAFRAPRFPVAGVGYRGDYDGDGKSDIFWHNAFLGTNVIWKNGNSATTIAAATVADRGWVPAGAGDFNGDGKSDLLWRHASMGSNVVWLSGNAATAMAVAGVPDSAWTIAGIGDFNGDHKDDILWRNISTGANLIWRSASASTTQAVATVALDWTVVGVGDFDGNGAADILWRNRNDGRDVIWKGGNSATSLGLTWVPSQSWVVVGAGDFDGDGKSDVLWRNANGSNVYWKGGNSTTAQTMTTVASNAWVVVGIGDFDGDGKDDILWRNSASGANLIWKAANGATTLPVTTVAAQSWVISG